MEIEDAVALLNRPNVSLVELRYEYSAGGEPRGGGFFVQGETATARIAQTFHSEFRNTLTALMQSNHALIDRAGPTEPALRQRLAAQSALLGPEPRVFEALIGALPAGVSSLTADARIKSVRSVGPPTQARKLGTFARPATASVVRRDQWVPDSVNVYLRQPDSLTRYVHQDLIWNSGRSIWFGDAGGYEADFFLNYYDGLAWLDTAVSFGIPQVRSWDSNLPGSYLDSRAGDPNGEQAFTIGTTRGDLISTGTWYYTHITTNFGNSDWDYGKMVPQLTDCRGTPCNTWTMYADDTCPPGNWDIGIPSPGDYSWTRTGGGYPSQPPCL